MCWKKMPGWLKGTIVGIIIIILSYLVPAIFCPTILYASLPMIQEGTSLPNYAEGHPICSILIANPLASHYPFPKILLPWIIFLIITSAIGWIIGKVTKKRGKK